MANLAAKDPNYSGPDVATRFRRRPEGAGRPSRAWIRERLNRHGKDGTATDSELEQILDHQIEVAKSWEVRIVGRDEDGRPIKVASGRDSTEASKFLCGLIGLRPLLAGDEKISIPAEVETKDRSLIDIIADTYRHMLVRGKLTRDELHELTKSVLSIDQTKIALVLKLLGKNAAGKSPEEIQRMIDGTAEPAPAQDAEEPKP